MSLFDEDNKRYFDSILIITDRKSIDSHLTRTFNSLNQKLGIVHATERENSLTLKKYIEEGKPIIISTIQKFPRISKYISGINGKKFAIIIDEVHSSQSGEYSNHIIKSLSSADEDLIQDDSGDEDLTDIDKLVIEEIQKTKKINMLAILVLAGHQPKNSRDFWN